MAEMTRLNFGSIEAIANFWASTISVPTAALIERAMRPFNGKAHGSSPGASALAARALFDAVWAKASS